MGGGKKGNSGSAGGTASAGLESGDSRSAKSRSAVHGGAVRGRREREREGERKNKEREREEKKKLFRCLTKDIERHRKRDCGAAAHLILRREVHSGAVFGRTRGVAGTGKGRGRGSEGESAPRKLFSQLRSAGTPTKIVLGRSAALQGRGCPEGARSRQPGRFRCPRGGCRGAASDGNGAAHGGRRRPIPASVSRDEPKARSVSPVVGALAPVVPQQRPYLVRTAPAVPSGACAARGMPV